jgi:membrane-associated phospholipid phosphatase
VVRRQLPTAFAAAFAGLAVLVARGAFTNLDGYAIRHLMPALTPTDRPPSLLGALVPFLRGGPHGALGWIAHIVTLPASFTPATLLTAALLLVLWRRGAILDALVWGGAFVAGNVVDVIGKSLLERPALYARAGGHTVHVASFDKSYPSGHAIRIVLVAALAAFVWRRAWPVLALWAIAGILLLVPGGLHVPTDVVGGALAAGFLVTSAWRRNQPWPADEPAADGFSRNGNERGS